MGRCICGTRLPSTTPAKVPKSAEQTQITKIVQLEAGRALTRPETHKSAQERDIIRRVSQIFAGERNFESFPFVTDHQHAYGVERSCIVVDIKRFYFYAWLAAAFTRSRRASAGRALADRNRILQVKHVPDCLGSFGYPHRGLGLGV